MGTEAIRTELKSTNDTRIRAGVRAALEHLGQRHGLTKPEQQEFADEVDQACVKALAAQSAERFCDVVIEEREDSLAVQVRPASSSAKENSGHLGSARKIKSHNSGNGNRCATFVRRFHKSPTRS